MGTLLLVVITVGKWCKTNVIVMLILFRSGVIILGGCIVIFSH